MSLVSPWAANVLLQFESGLQDRRRESARAIEMGRKEIRAVPWANNCIECQEQSEAE